MTISLGPITFTTITGNASGGFRFGGAALGEGIDFDAGAADLRLFLRMEATGSGTSSGGTPEVPGTARGVLFLSMSGEGSLGLFGEADMAPMRLGMTAYNGDGATTVEGFMTAGLKLGMYAEQEEGSYGFLVDRRPIVTGLSGIEFLFLDAGLDLAHSQITRPTYGLAARIGLQSPARGSIAALTTITDRMEFGDALLVVLRELLAEGFALDGDVTQQFTAIQQVADALVLAEVVSTQLEAINLLVAAIAFGDIARWMDVAELTEGFDMGDAVAQSVKLAALLVEQILMDGAPEALVKFVAVLGDGMVLDGSAGSVATLIEALQEGVNFALHLDIDDGHYSAYVINTESKGLTQYAHYPFNSFAALGDRYFGMTPDGIRELEGGTDAGSPIAGRFRLAMTNLGTGHMKRMLAAYLGYTSTGALRLKTITVGADRVKRADYYKLLPQPSDETIEARIKIGQGLRSVYWGFEVEAIDGAEFMIDVLNLLPIVVEGMIQGQGGGKR